MTKVYAPNQAYQGLSAGVHFVDGQAETDDERVLAYFRRAGYGIGEAAARSSPAPEASFEAPSARIHVGGRLRDAAVEPRPSDFLPPVNAGVADPHGPSVVSPGLHAVGPAPIRPGPVAVDDPARQSAEESELASRVLIGQELSPDVVQDIAAQQAQATVDDAPSKSASKADWVDYAVSQGMARDEAEDATKADLQERHEG